VPETLVRLFTGSLPPPESLVRLVPALPLVVPPTDLAQWRLRPVTAGFAWPCWTGHSPASPPSSGGFGWRSNALPANGWRALPAGLAGSATLLLKAPLLILVAAAAGHRRLLAGRRTDPRAPLAWVARAYERGGRPLALGRRRCRTCSAQGR